MDVVDHWSHLLTGQSRERIVESRTRIESFGISHLSHELALRPDVDSAVACSMLMSAIDELTAGGIPKTKIASKLRNDPDVWPTVSELLAAGSVLRLADSPAGIELDARWLDEGPRPDIRFALPGAGPGVSIEFKTIGLSDKEAAFFRKAAEVLPAMCPKYGVSTQHIEFERDHHLFAPTREQRRTQELANRRGQKRAPNRLGRELNAAVVAAHFTEQRYLERARGRIEEAFVQLPDRDMCWVGLWWTNGAPIGSMQQLLATIDMPRHVLGIILIGAAVVFPDPEIHHYQIVVPRECSVPDEHIPIASDEDHPLAEIVLRHTEESSGVRPTLIVHPHGPRSKRQPVLFRDGRRRIFPFNLLLDRDPPGVREFAAKAVVDDPTDSEGLAMLFFRGEG